MLFDTHCHFETQDEAVCDARLARAHEAGVAAVLAVGGSAALNAAACAAVRCAAGKRARPDVFCALGYDRDQVAERRDPLCVARGTCVAVGEIGLDYVYAPETRPQQCALFEEQLAWAQTLDLPVAVHTRAADEDTLAILKHAVPRGVIHCFTGSQDFARRLLDLGLYISLSGIVTFRSAQDLRALARYIPRTRLLLETDAPYLAPVPVRGRTNEPAYLTHTCAVVAQARGVHAGTLAEETTSNAAALFALAYADGHWRATGAAGAQEEGAK